MLNHWGVNFFFYKKLKFKKFIQLQLLVLIWFLNLLNCLQWNVFNMIRASFNFDLCGINIYLLIINQIEKSGRNSCEILQTWLILIKPVGLALTITRGTVYMQCMRITIFSKFKTKGNDKQLMLLILANIPRCWLTDQKLLLFYGVTK